MAIDPRQIELTREQQQALAEKAEQTGKPWPDVFADALRLYPVARHVPPVTSAPQSFYDAMLKDGAIGVVEEKLPHDLATNPIHMEGFGRDCETGTG